MSLTLHWTIPDPQRVCRTFSCIKVYRAPSAQGPFVEISTPQTRPDLDPAVSRYAYSDPQGAPSLWYATSYLNPQTHAESSRGAPQQGRSDPALGLISVARLKGDYLWGLKLADKQGRPLPDSVFETGIRTALAWVERRLGFSLAAQAIDDEPHDFRPDQLRHYALVHVDRLPIQSVQSLRLVLPGQDGATSAVTTGGLRWQRWEGSVQVAPGTRFGTYAGGYAGYGAAFPQWMGFAGSPDYLPGALRVSYTTGFAEGEVPADLLDLVAKAAALQPLALAGDLVGPPGVSSSSIGLDGLSQSVGRIASQSGNAYASRMSSYAQQLQTDLKALKAYYLGVRMRVA